MTASLKLSKAVEGFAIFLLGDGYSSRTVESYSADLQHLARFLNDPLLARVSLVSLRSFLAYLRTEHKPRSCRKPGDTRPLSGATIHKNWTAIRSFFKWCEAEGLIKTRPDLDLAMPQSESRAVMVFAREEVDRLIQAAKYVRVPGTETRKAYKAVRRTADRDVAIIKFLLDSGVRVSEMCRLTVCDVNLVSGAVFISTHGRGQKTRSRFVSLGKSARLAVWEYLAHRESPRDNDPLFLTDDGKPMTRDTVRQLLSRLGRQAGVSNVYAHRFRHTCAYRIWKNRGDILLVNQILGHRSLTTTKHYLQRITGEDLHIEAVAASPLDNWNL